MNATTPREHLIHTEVDLHQRPLPACVLLPDGEAGLITINGVDYALAYHSSLPRTGGAVIRGYRLAHCDGEKVYDLRMEGADLCCECGDSVFRKHLCKHSLAILSLVADGKLSAIDEEPDRPRMD